MPTDRRGRRSLQSIMLFLALFFLRQLDHSEKAIKKNFPLFFGFDKVQKEQDQSERKADQAGCWVVKRC